MVYDLARFLNRDGETIPENSITKPPSAELRPDQLDSDSLPPYDDLDPIMRAYVEEGLYVEEIAEQGFDRATVERVIGMIERNEYKRLQAPIGLIAMATVVLLITLGSLMIRKIMDIDI